METKYESESCIESKSENIKVLPIDGVKREKVDPSPRSSELKEGETRPRGPCVIIIILMLLLMMLMKLMMMLVMTWVMLLIM